MIKLELEHSIRYIITCNNDKEWDNLQDIVISNGYHFYTSGMIEFTKDINALIIHDSNNKDILFKAHIDDFNGYEVHKNLFFTYDEFISKYVDKDLEKALKIIYDD